MKLLINLQRTVCVFLILNSFLFVVAQNNSYLWSYINEKGVKVTLNGAEEEGLIHLCDNNDTTSFVLSTNDVVEFTFPYAMNFTGMLICGVNEIPDADFLIHAKKEAGDWENNKGKSYTGAGDRGKGKFYTVSNLTTAAGEVGYIQIQLVALNDMEVSAFQLFGFPNIADGNLIYPKDLIRSNSGRFTAEDIPLEDGSVDNVIDGGRTTRYVPKASSFWIQYEFDEPQTVNSYMICVGSASDYTRDPKNWVLKGSNSESEDKDWEVISLVNGYQFPRSNYPDAKFPVTNPGSYKAYRLEVRNNGQQGISHISEFQLYAEEIYTVLSGQELIAALEGVEPSNVSGAFMNKAIYLAGGDWSEKWDNLEQRLAEVPSFTSVSFDKTFSVSTEVSDIFSEKNPNSLKYFPAEATNIPVNWNKNVVAGVEAQTYILLIDGYEFDNMIEFTATEAYYERVYNTVGWASLYLPFALNIGEQDGIEEIKEFAEVEEENTLVFKTIETTRPNTPYIIKVEKTGEMAFIASDVIIPVTEMNSIQIGGYTFKGTFTKIDSGEGYFILDADGSGFGMGVSGSDIPAFRSYMEANVSEDVKKLAIGNGDNDTTKLESLDTNSLFYVMQVGKGEICIYSAQPQQIDIYGLEGNIVERLQLAEGETVVSGLKRGIYLVNNQKVVIR